MKTVLIYSENNIEFEVIGEVESTVKDMSDLFDLAKKNLDDPGYYYLVYIHKNGNFELEQSFYITENKVLMNDFTRW